MNWRGARIKTKENTKEKDCAGKWLGCECPFTEDGSMHDRQGRESGQKLFFYNNVEAVINQNFKNVSRTILRLRVDKERFYFAHLYINDKHKIKVTKNLNQPKYLRALIHNQPLLKTSAFHKLLEIFLKVARNSLLAEVSHELSRRERPLLAGNF